MPYIEIKKEALPLDQPYRIDHQPTGIVIVRQLNNIMAFYDSCPHAQWRLSDGHLSGNLLECPGHGWQFEITTGECVDVPAYCLKSLKVIEFGELIRIELEEDSKGNKQRELNESEALV